MKTMSDVAAAGSPWRAATSCGSPQDGRRVIITGSLFSALYFVSVLLIRWPGLHEALRVPVALAPAPAFAAFMLAYVRSIRGMDELQRRIQLEALAFAFPASLLILLTLGLLERVVTLPPDDLSYRHVWGMMPLLYFLGVWLALRRYR